ncbi:hypothetical protein COA01_15540 [Bacillus cereus]|uniref:HD domain-containing protein n=1 Tax=Bacillus cereus TaxID=1396 RepID=UPI000BFE5D42|nr:HD domain-containing protein [Bacillus cereus]PGP20951.1 hypothetical protein COA01_15540 [Bacillus cereus]
MDFSTIFKISNVDITEEDLIPASLITSEEAKKEYEQLTGRELMFYSEICQIGEKLGFNPQNIYFLNQNKALSTYYYYDFPVFVDIHHLSEEALEMFQIPEKIIAGTEFYKEKLSNKEYGTVISMVDSKIRILTLKKLYPLIPDEEKYEWFLEVYTFEDYGFQQFTPELMEDAFGRRPQDVKEELKKRLDEITQEEELVIYRAQGTESTPLEKAYSWTLSFNFASKFAGNLGMHGDVFVAKVKKENVIDYITNRKEDEILVRPEHVYDIQNMQMVKPEEEMDNLGMLGYLSDYHRYLNELHPDLFFNPYGIHGMKHTERVLLHVQSLCLELEVDDLDTIILSIAALYHDIGRKNDDIDPYHGEESWKKLIALGLIDTFEEKYEIYEDEIQILKFIIENHCLNDELVWSNLEKLTFYRSKEEVKFLMKVFKDADGLDRVRIGDLDTKYLRFEESKRRYLFAKQIFREIR